MTDTVTGEQRITTSTYNSLQEIESIDGPRADVDDITTMTYDDEGRLKTTTNALGHVTEILEYNDYGQPTSVKDANGVISTLEYDVKGNLKRVEKGGLVSEYFYNAVGLLKQTIAPSGATLTYDYDEARRLTSVTDTAGNYVSFTFDVMGNQTSRSTYDAQGVLFQTMSQTFDGLGQLTSIVGANGQVQSFDYDDYGRLKTTTDGKSNTTQSSFDAINRVTKSIDALNGETALDYDAQGHLKSLTDAEARTTTYERNAFGDVMLRTSPDTGTTSYTYDSAGNLKTKTDARGVVTTYDYDALNRMTRITYSNSDEVVEYVYDETTNGNYGIGRLTRIKNDTSNIHYQYDSLGRLVKETQVTNSQTYSMVYGYNAQGQLDAVTYPSGVTLGYAYNVNGQLENVTATMNGQTQTLASDMAYLPFGPMKTLNYGNGLSLFNSYDADYRLEAAEVTGLKNVTYAYDLNNNIEAIIPESTSEESELYTYDELNRLIEAAGNYGSLAYDYDGIGNRTDLTRTDSTVEFRYNSELKLSELNDSAAAITPPTPLIELKFDEASGSTIAENTGTASATAAIFYRWAKAGSPGASGDAGDLSYFFYGLNSLVEVDAPSVDVSQGTFKLHYKTVNPGHGDRYMLYVNESLGVYFNNGELSVFNDGTSIPSGVTYPTDKAWHEVVFNFKSGVENGAKLYLDGNLILTTTVVLEGSLDTLMVGGNSKTAYRNYAGNIDQVQFFGEALEPAALNVVTEVDGVSVPTTEYDYSPNGNTTQKGDQFFGYNAANRLSSFTQGDTTASYFYNGKGERVRKVVNGAETQFVFNASGQLIAEADANGTIIKEYVYLNNQPFAQIVQGNVYFYHNSHLGTPELLTDTNQAIVWQASYTPFGQASVEVSTLENNVRFPGQYFDAESGLHYNYFRDYDPETGRYIESDLIGLNAGVNTYGYVSGNPVMRSDVTGLCPWCPVPIIAGDTLMGWMVASGLVSASSAQMANNGPEFYAGPAPIPMSVIINEYQNAWNEVFGSNVVYDEATGNPATDRANPEVARQQEYERAKNFCDGGPPEGSNDCSSLSKKIDHAEQCIDFYEQWDAKWLPGRHAQKIQGWRNRLENAKREHNARCAEECN
ncbi:RHS repeat domain-containing protein [Pleionea sediminis]|uniref:RHS repeat domain-containing protein n=1 Tax=Pleionea sediminis TaxID=2569479 RepID=UPI0013DE70BC|nr:RHS repeat domain-containing protein [Pleionea sediminis]